MQETPVHYVMHARPWQSSKNPQAVYPSARARQPLQQGASQGAPVTFGGAAPCAEGQARSCHRPPCAPPPWQTAQTRADPRRGRCAAGAARSAPGLRARLLPPAALATPAPAVVTAPAPPHPSPHPPPPQARLLQPRCCQQAPPLVLHMLGRRPSESGTCASFAWVLHQVMLQQGQAQGALLSSGRSGAARMPAACTVPSTSSASACRAEARRCGTSVRLAWALSACAVLLTNVLRSAGECGRILFHTALRPAAWTRPLAALPSMASSLVLQHARR